MASQQPHPQQQQEGPRTPHRTPEPATWVLNRAEVEGSRASSREEEERWGSASSVRPPAAAPVLAPTKQVGEGAGGGACGRVCGVAGERYVGRLRGTTVREARLHPRPPCNHPAPTPQQLAMRMPGMPAHADRQPPCASCCGLSPSTVGRGERLGSEAPASPLDWPTPCPCAHTSLLHTPHAHRQPGTPPWAAQARTRTDDAGTRARTQTCAHGRPSRTRHHRRWSCAP